ncbi:MAG: hypothetical protein MUE81_02600 [Thermoflexibacter sp.]|nr:hypothetical protein [Thermoflexibacter sp.]
MQIPVIFLAFANDKVDNARYLRNLPKELDGIRKALLPAIQANLCEVVERANVTIENILDIFQDDKYRDRIAIFHYGGHADGYQLLLEQLDGSHAVAQGGGLVSFFSKQKGLKLVFFNGCSTHQQSVELVQAGISAVIGTSNAINDDIATDLSIRFYKGLAEGLTLDRAWYSAIDEVKIKQGEGNTRGLYRKEAAKQMIDERFPWELMIREGAEIVKEFNLPAEVNNPLFGLPEIPKTFNLPILPYQFLMRYDRSHAEVFFGRASYIRDLYNRVTDKNSAPIITVCGQAGVGKSSLFDAGLTPRLENSHIVKYVRRVQDKGLLGTLREALGINATEQDNVERESILNAKDIYVQQPIDTLDLNILLNNTPSDTSNNVVTTENIVAKETFEGQSSEVTNTQNVAVNNQINVENDPSKEQLILELRQLAEKTDLTLQGLIFDLINQLSSNVPPPAVAPLFDTVAMDMSTNKLLIGSLLARWKQIEQENGKPLVVILDQVEEAYTRPMASKSEEYEESQRTNMGEKEIETFLKEIKQVFNDPTNAPKGKLILGFRKEFQPDFEEWFKYFTLPQNKVFVDNLKRKEIIEIVEGLTSSERLKRNYQLSIESNLPEILADDLLEDQDSAIAPLLQMILTKLWKSCEHQDRKIFTIQKYQDLRREGLLMQDFVEEQLVKMREWNAKAEESGLVLDVLMQHTTRFGTAGTQDIEELKKLYAHKSKTVISIIDKAKESYLLVDLGKHSALAHDALAPIIQEKYRKSMYPAQRAMRLLENKIANFNPQDKNSSVMDERELGVVVDGGKGMRLWTEAEMQFIEASKAKVAINKRNRRLRFIAGVIGIALLVVALFISLYLRNVAKDEQTRAEASQLLTLAVQNDDMTMALRLAERADSLAMSVGDNTVKDKLIEIISTNNFYNYEWAVPLSNTKICIDEQGSKILYLEGTSMSDEHDLVVRNWDDSEALRMNFSTISDYDISPDGRKLLTVSEDVLRLWDLSGKQLSFYTEKEQKETYYINNAGFLPNGSGFYIFSNNKEVKFFDFKNKEFFNFNFKTNGNEIVNNMIISPDGSTIAFSDYYYLPNGKQINEVRSINTATKQFNFKQNYLHLPLHLAFSPDASQLLVTTDTLALLHNAQGDTLARWTVSNYANFTSIAFSPNGEYLFTANQDKTIKQYNINQLVRYYKQGTIVNMLPQRVWENDSYIESIKFTPDGSWLMTMNQEFGIKFWNLANNHKILYGEVNNMITHIAFAPDGKEVYSKADNSLRIDIWQTQEDSTLAIKETIDLSENAYSISFNEKNIVKDADTISLLDYDLREHKIIPYPYGLRKTKPSQDGNYLVALLADTVRVYAKDGRLVTTIADPCTDAFLSPNNQYLVTINYFSYEYEGSTDDATARIWDMKGKLVQTLKGHTEIINDVCFSPDSKYLVTASKDKTAIIWTIQGEEVAALYGHSQSVNAVAFSPTNNYVLTGSDDYTARLWNLNGEELKVYIAHKVNKIAFAPNGSQFITAGTQDYDQKDYFNISMNRKTAKSIKNIRYFDSEREKDKYMVSSIILWDIANDYKNWLSSGKIYHFTLTEYLAAGASVSFKALKKLENIYELNAAGLYYLSSEAPISGVTQKERIKYAKELLEKSIKKQRSYDAVLGLTEINSIEKGEFDVEEMLKTKDIDELEEYMAYIFDNKLKYARNIVDSLEYWKGLEKIAELSLSVRQTPYALSTLKSANYVLGDKKKNVKMNFNKSLNEMREFADFFRNKQEFKKQSLLQSVEIFEYILKDLIPTSEDYKNAAQVYYELSWVQLENKELIEAEKSINRGIELNKENRYLYINQILLFIFTNRIEQARLLYQKQIRNDLIDNEYSFKATVKDHFEFLQNRGLKANKAELNWLR